MFKTKTSVISKEEKKRILELHLKTKISESEKKKSFLISEQVPPDTIDQTDNTLPSKDDPYGYLEWILKNCKDEAKGYQLRRRPNTNEFSLVKQEGNFYTSIYPNGNFTKWEKEDDKFFEVETGKFFCKQLQDAENASKPESKEMNALLRAGYQTSDQLLKMGKTPNEIRSLYTQHPKYKNLFIVKNENRVSGYSTEQQEFIDTWTGSTENSNNFETGVWKIRPTSQDFARGDWRLDGFFIAPNSEKYFDGGLKVFYNFSKKTEPTKSTCRTRIKEFADKYKRRDSSPSTVQYINYNRAFIQDCVNMFKFGGPLSAVKDDLNLLGGMVSGGAGRRSPWRIELPQKL